MANVMNITDRLKHEKKQIQIGEELLTVNTAFEAMVKIESIERRKDISDTEKMVMTLQILLGDDYAKLQAFNFDVQDMKTVFTAIMAVVQAVPFEEMEARFQAIEQQ